MNKPDSITIRVYGLLMHEGRILLSRENIADNLYTKFPGGGLELGEGISDCLQREFREEVDISLSQWKLFHLNENFLASAFHQAKQVLSIYFRVWSDEIRKIKTGDPDKTPLPRPADQVLYWADVQEIQKEPISLPVDVQVVQLLTGGKAN